MHSLICASWSRSPVCWAVGAKLILAPDADHAFHGPAKTGRNYRDVLATLLDSASNWIIATGS